MLAPLIVPEIVPARYARLLLESSHASPPSSRQSFQKPTVNFTASIVALLLITTLRSSSQVSGNLLAPASLNQSSRYAQVEGTEQSGTAFQRPSTTLTFLLCS